MPSYEVTKVILESSDFKNNYSNYLKKKDNHLSNFLDNIDLNKKYYRMNINKNQRYRKETTKDTSIIKEVNSLINKLTNKNYEKLRVNIIQKIKVPHIIPYIINKLTENSITHHIYIPLYVGILKDINSRNKNHIILKICNKYHTEFFYGKENSSNDSQYEKLCSKNKNIDNIIGFSLLISYLEKEGIINNYIEKVLDPFMDYLSSNSKDDNEVFKMLVSFSNISIIHFKTIPDKYQSILNKLKSDTTSSKIKFKIMDILGE
tara:strand:- start:1898 stop:2683 length:786 start_codon:yes stop_codon:yes gene_type:complete